MNKFKIKDLSKVQTGPFGSLLHNEDYVMNGTPIITVENLGDIGIVGENIPMVSDRDKERLSRFILKEGDIVFSRVGSIDRNVCIKKEEEGWLFSGRCLRLRCNNKVNPRFLSYYFKQKSIMNKMKHISVGCTMPSLNTRIMEELEVDIPELSIQNSIAYVLDTLNKKIELNNKINEELESIAKTIYDYWFVQFDFPDENGKPYRSSGGAMVYNPILKREIPQGWVIDKLEKALSFERGVEPGSAEYSTNQTSEKQIPFIRVSDLGNEKTSLFISQKAAAEKYCEPSDVLVSFDGSIGKIAVAMSGSYSSGIRKIKATNNNYSDALIYYIFQSPLIQKTMIKHAIGSNILHASSSISHLYFLYERKIAHKYMKIVEQMYQQIIKNKQQNKQLAELRDFLLPLLMNGQVTIEEVKTQHEYPRSS